MGVLKLSILDEQYKAQREKKLRVLKNGKRYHVSACSCPCECFVKKGEIRMDIGETASSNID